MRSPRWRGLSAAITAVLLIGCSTSPTPPPSPGASSSAVTSPGPSSGPSTSPSSPPGTPTPQGATFPLAVVTGLTNLKSTITIDELTAAATAGTLVVPCGIQISTPAISTSATCVPATQVVAKIRAKQSTIAVLPPGLVEPATQVLPFAGDGPYGLFGPDLFGDPQSRALPYPLAGTADGSATLDSAWTAYDASKTWTLASVGSMCSDRGAAHQAVTLGRGWDWVFDGGTAKYKGKPFSNPNPPPGITRHLIVTPVETGNAGVTASIVKRADVALGNHKCPILPTKSWKPNDTSSALNFAVPEDVLTRWSSFLGIDAVYLPADHQSDRGVTGIKSTLKLLDKHGFPHTGLGLDLDQALEPAYVEVEGLKIAFVSWDNVPGPTHAAANTPGVAWLSNTNVKAAVGKAKAAGADVIICDPQWWGPDEYLQSISASQQRAIGWMDKAGCSQILAGGLHISGAMLLRQGANGVSMVDAGTGNYQFGQDWWQATLEGVIIEQSFVGTKLVNVRLHPYVMIKAARAALLDPEGDGHYVLQRIWKASDLDYSS